MAGRKANPDTRYRVYAHNDKKYTYAAVQKPKILSENGKIKNTTVHIGKLDENLKFFPNARFRLLDSEEQSKYIFPDTWDISCLENKNFSSDLQKKESLEKDTKLTKDHNEVKSLSVNIEKKTSDRFPNTESESISQELSKDHSYECYETLLYGSFWLLEQIAKKIGLIEDLLKTFNNNIFIVNEILSLAIFPYISGRNYNRFAKWQNSHKTLIDYQLKSYAITKLSQKITDHHRMTLIKYRLQREPGDSCLSCDSTTRSAWGNCLADIRWGKNKDNEKLKNTLEVVIYSLISHEPIYYRTFAGNTSDISTIRTIIADLRGLGVDYHNIIFIFDRGYISDENIAAFVEADLSFIICTKVNSKLISQILLDIKYDSDAYPIGMKFDKDSRLFISQHTIPPFMSKVSDGTDIKIEGLKANLYLNPSKRTEKITDLKTKIEEELLILNKAKTEGFIPSDIKKYNALFEFFKVTENKDNNSKVVGINFSECEEKIRKEKSRCGFFASLMYNVNKTGKETLNQYVNRDEHEKFFNILKNQMNLYVQRNSTESGKNGSSFIAFTGLILISFLKNVWCSLLRGKYCSVLDMLDEMEPIRFCQYTNKEWHMTTFTMKQVEICRACGIEPPFECLPATLKK